MMKTFSLLVLLCFNASVVLAQTEHSGEDAGTDHVASGLANQGGNHQGPEMVPDLRKEKIKLKLQKSDIVVVPIPVSNPTLDTGLVLGGAYFYPQTEAQKNVQPPNVTGAAVFKSSNKSKAFAAVHQSYLGGNKWRVGGVFGHADLKLSLLTPGEQGNGPVVDWLVRGDFLATKITRRISGKWYAGILARYIDMNQGFSIDTTSSDFSTDTDSKSAGLGFTVEYDSRDKPLNSHSGNIFEVDAVFNGSTFGSDDSYRSLSSKYRSYHLLTPSLVLAWEAQACARSDKAPLWDACRISLRGFSATRYLGKSSASAQAEARWQFHRKWGAVAFAGTGYIRNPFSDPDKRDLVPSYGIGLRFMVLESQRINVRIDYARSDDSEALYLSVGEAF